MVVNLSSDACCAITPSKPGKRCRNQAGGSDARLSGEDVTDASGCAVVLVIQNGGIAINRQCPEKIDKQHHAAPNSPSRRSRMLADQQVEFNSPCDWL